jgi:hypothetical protein
MSVMLGTILLVGFVGHVPKVSIPQVVAQCVLIVHIRRQLYQLALSVKTIVRWFFAMLADMELYVWIVHLVITVFRAL